ncbi:MAG: ABC transporter ATP-binding protein [Planctomycetota bacterium]|nr:ABC transporter ATP-binding protein [Planctomycetota bacterium]
MSLVRFHGVSRHFDALVALAPLDLDVRAGEVFGLLGSNGAGKTTALRILCGLLEPTAGSVTIDGRDVAADPLAARRQFSFVPDGAPLYANLSPKQHLALVGRLHGVDEARIASETMRLLEALELADRANDPVGGFSRGMRQKTALACAILPRPKLLILDEPLNGLDAPTTAVFKEVLRAWADRGGSVLYTSHLLDVAERVCDRVAVLHEGKLLGVGSLDELRSIAGRDGTLEQVFGAMTNAVDPKLGAARILG